MENRKDIGKAISHKLNSLDRSPREELWTGISTELDNKKKRRRFLFWFFFAAISIGSISGYTYFTNFNSGKFSKNNIEITSTKTSNENNSNRINAKNGNSNDVNLNQPVSDNPESDNTVLNKKTNSSELVNSKKSESGKKRLGIKSNSGFHKNSKTTLVKNANAKSNSNNSNGLNTASKKLKNTISIHSKKSKKHQFNKRNESEESDISLYSKKSKKHQFNKKNKSSEGDTSLYSKNYKAGKNKNNGKKSNNSSQSNQTDASGKSIELNDLDNLKKSNESENKAVTNLDALKTEKNKTPATRLEERKLLLEELKKANQKKRDSLIAEKKAEKEKKDLAKNPKEEEPKDSTKTEVAQTRHEITIAPYFGFNYTGNFGNGNFLNSSKTSKKESEFNTSYGVLIRMMGSKKMGLQVGVGIINSVYSATFIREPNNFIYTNNVALKNITLQQVNNLFPNQTKVISRQETTFIEVPLEIYYILSDQKLGMATSVGLSFLKLQNSDVFLESETVSRMKIGTLENIAPFSSSFNLKFNLFYKITPKLYFDLYPAFQYQFMGYKDNSDYHPYFFSIKTGLSYKL